jgi:hypothetical protein
MTNRRDFLRAALSAAAAGASFGVVEPNISPWRRAVCGDMTSAFDFADPDNRRFLDELPDTTALAAAGAQIELRATAASSPSRSCCARTRTRATSIASCWRPVRSACGAGRSSAALAGTTSLSSRWRYRAICVASPAASRPAAIRSAIRRWAVWRMAIRRLQLPPQRGARRRIVLAWPRRARRLRSRVGQQRGQQPLMKRSARPGG